MKTPMIRYLVQNYSITKLHLDEDINSYKILKRSGIYGEVLNDSHISKLESIFNTEQDAWDFFRLLLQHEQEFYTSCLKEVENHIAATNFIEFEH